VELILSFLALPPCMAFICERMANSMASFWSSSLFGSRRRPRQNREAPTRVASNGGLSLTGRPPVLQQANGRRSALEGRIDEEASVA
jgi:hypothetical protein